MWQSWMVNDIIIIIIFLKPKNLECHRKCFLTKIMETIMKQIANCKIPLICSYVILFFSAITDFFLQYFLVFIFAREALNWSDWERSCLHPKWSLERRSKQGPVKFMSRKCSEVLYFAAKNRNTVASKLYSLSYWENSELHKDFNLCLWPEDIIFNGI